MGKGDNRKTPKMKQRRAWRKLKARINKKISSGKQAADSQPSSP